MIEKYALYSGGDESTWTLPFGRAAARGFEKTAAAPRLLPDVRRFIEELAPRSDAQYVLVNALGAGEYFGPNVNWDHFPEAALRYRPEAWLGVPLYDRPSALNWPYGFPTFYSASPYLHHRNKDPSRAYGEVELAAWNDAMKRVELVVRIDKDKCERWGGMGIWDRLAAGECPDVSMGSRVPFDTCAICCDWDTYRNAQSTFDPARHRHPGEAVLEVHREMKSRGEGGIRGLSITRRDYCEHARDDMGRLLDDGRRVFVYNDYPSFFDISFVFIGADRTAKVMMKLKKDGASKPAARPSSTSTKRAAVADEILARAFARGR